MTKTNINCCMVLITVLIPPLGLVCMPSVRDRDVIINLIITILLPGIGIIHAFFVLGLSCCTSTSCFFLPPLGVWLSTKKCGKVFLCLFFTLLLYIPGVIYAYYVSVNFGVNINEDNEIELHSDSEENREKELLGEDGIDNKITVNPEKAEAD